MVRILLGLLSLTPAILAQDAYGRLIDEALDLEQELRIGDGPDMPIERAYGKLAEAVRVDPRRWEAFALRGTNRCKLTVVCRRLLGDLLEEKRVAGAAPEDLQATERNGRQFLEQRVQEAMHNFRTMQRLMRERNEVDPNRLLFGAAAVKYARGEYLQDRSGGRGAIDEFKELIRRRWKVPYCSEFIARCHLELGISAFVRDAYEQAHEHWDTALRWVQSPETRSIIFSNKAAAFDLDNEYGYAEEIVRTQIEQEPGRPGHWKNLGLMFGHQNELRAALEAYRRCRELCPAPIAPLHGNAWLKAAMIHGKLLEEDGDLHLAWRLFLEYRAMLGDNYSFCLNFGEFALHLKRYELAWVFLTRARDLQPYCVMPYQLVLQTAIRMEGTDEEMKERVKKARKDLKGAMRDTGSKVPASVRRLCGGLRERPPGRNDARETLDPDPLAGLGSGRPPEWILAAAREREPFRRYDPALDGAVIPGRAAAGKEDEEIGEEAGKGWGTPALVGLGLLGLLSTAGAILVFLRRRGRRAAAPPGQ